MEKKNVLTKGLAIAGTVLVWFPILATIIISALGFFRRGFLRVDYLMPAELFLFALAGGLLLLWAAMRVRSRRAIIGGGLGATVIFLAASMLLASVTGLASGQIGMEGWPWVLVLGFIALYSLALVVIGVGGILLVRDLNKPSLPEANLP